MWDVRCAMVDVSNNPSERIDRKVIEDRTKAFALRLMKLCQALPKTFDGRTIAGQLFRCGTSVASNYRAAGRGRSKAEFIAKMGIVEEEADECCFWLELIIESGMMKESQVGPLLQEANEIVSIVVATKRTAKQNT